ncbi:MFS transporter [Thalassospira lucentensis]|uniref:MFS transporter n=1 Tax=Thalassospira lucentensis TaxID=168935 RepID=UPI0003B5D20B|nr:MFS transporter [Thalassospira lucentensis]RCK23848.1 arabinose ABC transporter permease [Thalassospira lucentensis MCCC 1A00383 = DSM 14000]
MNQTTENYATATSSGLERDARQQSAGDAHDPGQIALGVIIGRTSEFFDFFVYCIASVLVFPQLLFPGETALIGTMYSFAIFSLAFIARPVGSLVFMTVDRRHGRGVKLTIAMFMLGGSTAAMAFLPSFDSAGVFAIYLLCAFRFLQGLAWGGAWDGLSSLLALNAPDNRKGWYAMIPQLGAPLGFMLASSLFAYLILTLHADDFLAFGWRYAFFVAFAINVVALFARLRLVATSEFGHLLEQNELHAARVMDTLKHNGRTVLLGALVPMVSYALFHLVTVFALTWVYLYAEGNAGQFLLTQGVGAVLCAFGIIASGFIADQLGRRRLLGYSAGIILAGAILTPLLYTYNIINEGMIVLGGFAVLGLCFGQAAGTLASNFKREYRYTGSALTSDLAWLLGAGFAPLIALYLCDKFGLPGVGAYLMSGAVVTLLVLQFNKQFGAKTTD